MDRLTMDSIAAQRAGMTYGQWKALHPHTDAVEVPDKDVRLCKVCGKPIINMVGGKRRLYCSPECANEAVVERMRARYYKKGDVSNGKI